MENKASCSVDTSSATHSKERCGMVLFICHQDPCEEIVRVRMGSIKGPYGRWGWELGGDIDQGNHPKVLEQIPL